MARRHTKSRTASSRIAETGNQAVDNLEAVQHGVQAGSRQFNVLGEQAFDAWMRSGNETLQRALALNVELASWGREQLDDSLVAVRSLAQCRSLGDAYGIQLGLVRASMETSLRHANRVLGLATRLMSGGARAGEQAQLHD